MKRSYIDYAMSVIWGRALPDVRDGLKPVHRRILYAMYDMGMTPDKPHKKSAWVVGQVLARYHPHGDAAVYDAMVRLAQPFSSRYPLIDGHGNFGSIDGDAAAAMRYTEARMSKIAMELVADIDKETVDFIPNYDESLQEPTVLPARFPNLLVNGAAGIAVGMATNIPPHNLGEVIDGLVQMIDNPDISIRELMLSIKGPDFPTGGLIMGRQGIKDAYHRGRGSITVRARAEIEPMSGGKSRIVVTELPFQVNKAKLVERIAALVRDKKIDGITDLRDESDRTGLRVVVELRRDANPTVVLNQLYKHTQMQDSFGVIMLALVDGRPQVLNLKSLLTHYLDHQKEVVTRRTRFELDKAEARAHIVEGLRIALDKLDEVINTIRASRTVDIARQALMDRFALSEKQAQAILDMRLQRLTGLEREKLEEEYRDLIKTIARLREILANERMVLAIIKEELLEIKKKYGDPRRTEIASAVEKLEVEDLIAEEDAVITITHRSYIKRTPVDTYRSQKRGGRGVTGVATREEDFVEHLFVATTHHFLLFFTNRGKVYRLKVHEIPEAGRQAKGTAIVNLLYLGGDEKITAVIPVRTFGEEKYLFMATRHGTVKKTALGEFDSSRRDGIIAINLDEEDELIGVHLTEGQQDIILGTRFGVAIRFPEEEVRATGRNTRGVKGITLSPEDRVVSMDSVRPGADLLAVTENGFGKRTPLEEYRPQGRGGRGIIAIRTSERNGSLVAIMVVEEGDELMMVSSEGIIIRIDVADVSRMGRAAQGVTLMRLGENDRVVAVARVPARAEEEGE
ncbi:DNA gyrase subunit A [Clostridiales bacterium PH28_bin88]|nr:DNA gyrase subunit A [Clostridiales bacterium PH28_bin88]